MEYARDGLRPERVIAELRELQRLTGDEHGAQRVAWTETWRRALAWEREKLAGLPLVVETDPAGNQWFTLPGKSERALLIGSHIDSVPNGGWLDGCLGLAAGYEVLRHIASQGTPPVTVRLVDWADEEARFGRSLIGSAAAAGTLEIEAVRHLKDKDGIPLPDALLENGVTLERMPAAQAQLRNAAAYIELHIEQGPVLESLGLPMGAVLGTCGVERSLVDFSGQAAHAGSTPMHLRRDALAAAARWALRVREIAVQHGGVGTVGSMAATPGIITAIAGECSCMLDQRHLDAAALQAMVAEAQAAAGQIAQEENVSAVRRSVFQIEPVNFNPELIELADAAVQAVTGTSYRLPSGPLHDAAETARAGVPTVMLFVQSLGGLSHTPKEDTKEEHLAMAVAALDRLAWEAMERFG